MTAREQVQERVAKMDETSLMSLLEQLDNFEQGASLRPASPAKTVQDIQVYNAETG